MLQKCKIGGEIMDIEQFRELFLKRLTIDSETQDKRRKEFNLF